jgi:hypothetical protein
MKYRMNTDFPALVAVYLLGETATHPLTRLGARLPLSLLVADPGLRPRRFATITHPDTSSGASNCGF